MFIGIFILAPAVLALENSEAMHEFLEWKLAHKRTYKSDAEQETRFENFVKNRESVRKLNAASQGAKDAATFKLNDYGDWSEQEQARLRGFRGANKTAAIAAGFKPANFRVSTRADPDSINWVTKGVVGPIVNQGACGSCWAFSATTALESQVAIQKNTSVAKLSEQFLVDCDHQCGTYRFESGCDSGCNGGLMPSAWLYVKSVGGQPSEKDYPYKGVGGTCVRDKKPVSTLSNWEFTPENEDQIAAYVVRYGPVAVAVDAASWSFYTGGVMTSSSICPTIGPNPAYYLDHGVAVVGYGTATDGTPYWLIRNSWGAGWGEQGYCRILRGKGYCGVNLFACRPIL